jgi:hypothetical protein
LTFWLCTSALAGILSVQLIVVAVAWFLAWVTAATARSSARRRDYEGKTLQMLRQQTVYCTSSTKINYCVSREN